MGNNQRHSVLNAPLKLGLAVAASVGLTLTAMTPAMAVDYQVGPDEFSTVIGWEEGWPTDGWQTAGSGEIVPVDSALDFSADECSVVAVGSLEWGDIAYGIAAEERPSASTMDEAEALRSFFEGISIDISSGEVWFTITEAIYAPTGDGDYVFDDFDGDSSSAVAGAGTHSFPAGDIDYGFLDYYEGLIEDGDMVEIVAVGFYATPGTVVNSMSFGGDTHYFGTGDCLPIVPEAPGQTPGQTAPTPPKAVETARQ